MQLDIPRSSNDESILIWDIPIGWPWAKVGLDLFGLLATATTDFAPLLYYRYKDDHHSKRTSVPGLSRPPYTVTNQGLEVRVPKKLALESEFLLPLNYRSFEGDTVGGVYAIRIQIVKSTELEGFDGWQRVIAFKLPISQPLNISRVEYKFEKGYSVSVGLYIVPESELWSR